MTCHLPPVSSYTTFSHANSPAPPGLLIRLYNHRGPSGKDAMKLGPSKCGVQDVEQKNVCCGRAVVAWQVCAGKEGQEGAEGGGGGRREGGMGGQVLTASLSIHTHSLSTGLLQRWGLP